MPRKNRLIKFITIFSLFFGAPNLANAFKSKDLNNLQEDFNNLIEEILPQNVTISAQKINPEKLKFLQEESQEDILDEIFAEENSNQSYLIGSGFFISEDGLIATNYHVIAGASSINIKTFDEKEYVAKLISFDEKSDIALLKIESENKFKYVEFGNSNKVNLADLVILVGNPFDLGISVGKGIISAKNRFVKNANNYPVFQIDAAVNKGNSGGAIFNVKGELIAVTSAIFSPTNSSSGIGFALPANLVKKVINDLREYDEVIRGWIGISIQELNPKIIANFKINHGVFVNDVDENSPSFTAKMQSGDIILKFNEKDIKNISQLTNLIENYPINDFATITIWRDGKEQDLEVKIQQNNLEENRFSQFELKEEKGQIKINSILKNSPALKKGLKVGDILLKIDGIEVKSIANAQKLINLAFKENRKILLVIKRQDKKQALTLSVK